MKSSEEIVGIVWRCFAKTYQVFGGMANNEVDVSIWLDDDLHPRPNRDSYSFQKYVKEICNIINYSVPKLASVMQFKRLC